jgi:hypothetical protein
MVGRHRPYATLVAPSPAIAREDSPMSRPRAAALVLVALVASVTLLGGCSQKAASPSQSADSLDGVAPAPLTQMTPAEKTSKIASSFPMQVPVPEGDVQRGEAQGGSAWVYEIVVSGDVKSVQRWYLDVYAGSEWTVLARTDTVLDLQKNRAQTQLRFEGVRGGEQPKTRVTAGIGVGTPVLETH